MSEDEVSSLAVVVVNYGSHQLIEDNLGPLAMGSNNPRIVIVDNFSTAAELEKISRVCRKYSLELVASDENLGFGIGVNKGVDRALRASPSCLVLLNPDAVITREALSQLLAYSLKNPMELISPRIEDPSGKAFFAGAVIDMRTGQTMGAASPRRTAQGSYREWLSGACLAFSPELWNRTGGFAEDYFLYWEDVDFSFRAVAAGARLHYAEDVLVVHDEGGTQERRMPRSKSNLYYYYNIRNRMVFARKWLAKHEMRMWRRATWQTSREVILRGGRRQLLGSWSVWRSWVQGIVDGQLDRRGARR